MIPQRYASSRPMLSVVSLAHRVRVCTRNHQPPLRIVGTLKYEFGVTGRAGKPATNKEEDQEVLAARKERGRLVFCIRVRSFFRVLFACY